MKEYAQHKPALDSDEDEASSSKEDPSKAKRKQSSSTKSKKKHKRRMRWTPRSHLSHPADSAPRVDSKVTPPTEHDERMEDWNQKLFDELGVDDSQSAWSREFDAYEGYQQQKGRYYGLTEEEYRAKIVRDMNEKHHKKTTSSFSGWNARPRRERTTGNAQESTEELQANQRKEEEYRNAVISHERTVYYERWQELRSQMGSDATKSLRFGSMDIPWPVLKHHKGPITAESISAFYFSGFVNTSLLPSEESVAGATEKKKILREEQLKYHPDKFSQLFAGRLRRNSDLAETESTRLVAPDSESIESILNKAKDISQALNELWARET
jgi:hypothetical protein